MKIKLIGMLSIFVGCISISGFAFAGCPGDWFKSDSIVNYSGSIADKYDIGMTLIFDGDSLNGVYYYDKYLQDIKVKGTFTGPRKFELDASDASGNVTDTFTGTFPEHDNRIGNGGPLECEVMVGQWHRKSDGKDFPFYVIIDDAGVGTLDHRYRNAGAEDDRKIETAAQAFSHAVRDGDKKVVASLIEYPFEFYPDKKKKIKIKTSEQFISRYDDIVTPRVKEEILAAVPHNMFNKYSGIMMGSGVVWFNADGRVISIQDTYPVPPRRH